MVARVARRNFTNGQKHGVWSDVAMAAFPPPPPPLVPFPGSVVGVMLTANSVRAMR